MIKKFIIILLIGLIFPSISFAKDFRLLHIVPTKNIEVACDNGTILATGRVIGGCFLPGTNIIFINFYADSKYYSYILFHEIGHWLTDGKLSGLEWEQTADKFAYWIIGKPTAKSDIEYFKKLLLK